MDKDIKRAEERLEYLGSDPKTLELYRAREKSLLDRKNMINGAKEEGMKEGIEKGVEQTAKKLLIMGMDIEFIVDATGLEKEKIEQIKQNLN